MRLGYPGAWLIFTEALVQKERQTGRHGTGLGAMISISKTPTEAQRGKVLNMNHGEQNLRNLFSCFSLGVAGYGKEKKIVLLAELFCWSNLKAIPFVFKGDGRIEAKPVSLSSSTEFRVGCAPSSEGRSEDTPRHPTHSLQPRAPSSTIPAPVENTDRGKHGP